jgi:CRISPR-associated exonuclease Cas4
MSDIASGQAANDTGLAQVPLSALEHYEYCPRQAGLILLEDSYADDTATVRGSLLHQRVHEPGDEMRAGVRTLRALPVWHESLGLTGVCDVVEIYADGHVIPVEHKSGEYHPGGPADVQLAGQAMCLEEMFGTAIPAGAVFSSADRRRHEITIGPALRERVAANARRVRDILGQEFLPPAVADQRCRRCSMNHICMPKVLAGRRAYAQAEAGLFQPAQVGGRWDD